MCTAEAYVNIYLPQLHRYLKLKYVCLLGATTILFHSVCTVSATVNTLEMRSPNWWTDKSILPLSGNWSRWQYMKPSPTTSALLTNRQTRWTFTLCKQGALLSRGHATTSSRDDPSTRPGPHRTTAH